MNSSAVAPNWPPLPRVDVARAVAVAVAQVAVAVAGVPDAVVAYALVRCR